MMSQYVATKNPPWVRGGGLVQVPPGSSSILTAQQISHVSTAGTGMANPLDPRTGAALANPLDPRTGAGLANPLDPRTAAANPLDPRTAAAVVAVAQNQQAQQGPAVSASFGASIAAITLTQQGIAIPASLAATTQVANVNRSMVVEIARLPQPGVALPTSLASTGTVSYPAPRLIAQPVVPAAVVHNPPQQQYKQRVFTGTITKLHENFGFVDEDTFFQTSAVKGNLPKVGERVLVEATYNSSSPFKWNATRIQLLPNQVLQLNVQQSNNNRPALAQQGPLTAVVAAPVSLGISVTPNMNVGMPNMPNNQPAFSNVAQQGRWQEMAVMETLGQQQQQRLAMQHNSPHPWIQEMEYAEIHDNKGMRVSNLPRRHSPLRRESRRYRERERYSPPPRKRSRSPRRASSPRRRQRVVPRYMVQIPKISLDVKFGNVMELRRRYSNLYVPSDFCTANFVWQDAFPANRPFTLDHPCTFHIVGKDIESVFDQESATEPSDADYSYSAKVMLLSTPSLNEIFHKSCALAQDGEDVKENFVHPTRLISFLVGLKGKSETVAIGGPWSPSLDGPHPDKDPQTLINTAIRTCRSLTGIDLSQCSQWYRFAEIYYRRGESSSGRGKRVETVVLFMPDVWSCLPTRMEWDGMVATGCCKKQPLQEEQPPEAHMAESEEEKKEPTHHSELDPKSIKVNELKRELEARNLSVKGLKSQLIARLTKALKTESEEESASEEKTAEEPSESEEQKKEKEDDKKELLEKLKFPENPAIVVQASKTAKNGKFDCAVMSLSLLLDYRQEDNKEHSFEVSLFAELFNEMMMRDFGFRIYRALVELPEAKDEEKKKGDKREDKKKEEDSRRDSNDSDKEDEDSDEDDYEDDKRDKDRKKKRKKKMCTHDPHLLLSFVYFDQTHCGYLLDKDTEELLHTLGLMLSRAQVRKLIQKVCKRDTFTYRKLTDKPVDAEKPKTETLRITLEDLPLGNKKYIPALRGASEQNSDTSALVSYQGAMVDVGKLMEQLDRGEKARTETDEKVKHLQLQLESLSESSAAKEKASQKLSDDLEEQRQKLRSAEEDLRKVKSDADKYHKTLCSLKEGLQSSLFLTDSALQRRSRSSRTSNRDSSKHDTSNTDHAKNAGTAASEESDVKIEEKNSNSNSMDSESDKTEQYEQDSMDAE